MDKLLLQGESVDITPPGGLPIGISEEAIGESEPHGAGAGTWTEESQTSEIIAGLRARLSCWQRQRYKVCYKAVATGHQIRPVASDNG